MPYSYPDPSDNANLRPKFEVTAEDSVKFQLMAAIGGERATPASRNIVKLIDIFINEIRSANDTAMIRAVMRNQGGIQRLEELKDMIVKDYPVLK